MIAVIPDPQEPEYRLLIVWPSTRDAAFVRCYLSEHRPNSMVEPLQASAHPTTNLLEAAEAALDQFFAPDEAAS